MDDWSHQSIPKYYSKSLFFLSFVFLSFQPTAPEDLLKGSGPILTMLSLSFRLILRGDSRLFFFIHQKYYIVHQEEKLAISLVFLTAFPPHQSESCHSVTQRYIMSKHHLGRRLGGSQDEAETHTWLYKCASWGKLDMLKA